MNKPLISFLAGILIGYNGVRLMTHIGYLTVIAALVLAVYLK